MDRDRPTCVYVSTIVTACGPQRPCTYTTATKIHSEFVLPGQAFTAVTLKKDPYTFPPFVQVTDSADLDGSSRSTSIPYGFCSIVTDPSRAMTSMTLITLPRPSAGPKSSSLQSGRSVLPTSALVTAPIDSTVRLTDAAVTTVSSRSTIVVGATTTVVSESSTLTTTSLKNGANSWSTKGAKNKAILALVLLLIVVVW